MKKNEVQIGQVYVARVSDRLANVRIEAENRYGGWDGTNLETGKKVRIKSAQRLRVPSHTEWGRRSGGNTPPGRDRGLPTKSKGRKHDLPLGGGQRGGPALGEFPSLEAALEKADSHFQQTGIPIEVTRGKMIKGEFHAEFREVIHDPDAPILPTPTQMEEQGQETPVLPTPTQTEEPAQAKPAKAPKAKKEKAPKPEKKLSALSAAARVLEETGQAMTCQEMIAAMAAKGYWTSPGGKTPARHPLRRHIARGHHQGRPGPLCQNRTRQIPATCHRLTRFHPYALPRKDHHDARIPQTCFAQSCPEDRAVRPGRLRQDLHRAAPGRGPGPSQRQADRLLRHGIRHCLLQPGRPPACRPSRGLPVRCAAHTLDHRGPGGGEGD